MGCGREGVKDQEERLVSFINWIVGKRMFLLSRLLSEQ